MSPQLALDPGEPHEKPGVTMALSALDCARLFGMNPEVHQAVGMISVQIEGSVDAAAMRLLVEADATGRPPECIAADVVARRTRFSPELR